MEKILTVPMLAAFLLGVLLSGLVRSAGTRIRSSASGAIS